MLQISMNGGDRKDGRGGMRFPADGWAVGGKFTGERKVRSAPQKAWGGLLLEIKTSAYFCQRWTYPSGVGGFGGFGGSFGFGGLILDGRILGDVGFRSGLGVRFQGILGSSSLTIISEENGECPAATRVAASHVAASRSLT